MGEENDDHDDVTDESEEYYAIYSPALLVAVASNTTSIASNLQLAELQARIVCYLLVSKEMFSTYKCPATRQMGATMYNNNTSPEHIQGLETIFPLSQRWCIR